MKHALMAIGLGIILLGVLTGDGWAVDGACRINYTGLNKDRKVMGPVSAECTDVPGPISHSVPFGNWGVNSDCGTRIDGHQFQGWCYFHYACDHVGNCGTRCQDGWYEWNSCTTRYEWSSPSCDLYNSNGCTQQATTRGVNTHGTITTQRDVRCPYDSDGDGFCDTGGCADLSFFSSRENWMTLFELDKFERDDRVQKMIFPRVSVTLNCTAMSCSESGTSSWVSPDRYEDPSSLALVYAKAAIKVNWGQFHDIYGRCALWALNDHRYDCI